MHAVQVRQLAERYFGGWSSPSRTPSPSATAVVAAGAAGTAVAAGAAAAAVSVGAGQQGAAGAAGAEALPHPAPGEWLYRRRSIAGPAVMQAYYRPSVRSPDSLALELVRCGMHS